MQVDNLTKDVSVQKPNELGNRPIVKIPQSLMDLLTKNIPYLQGINPKKLLFVDMEYEIHCEADKSFFKGVQQ